MPQSQSDMILDSITIDNIDEAMYFYSYILEKIIKKKKKLSTQWRYNDESIKEFRYQKGNKPIKAIRKMHSIRFRK